jgi:hypothetical protein
VRASARDPHVRAALSEHPASAWHDADVKSATKGKAKGKTKGKTKRKTAKLGGKEAPAARKVAPRKDYGAPVDGFFARQPPPLAAILNELRALVAEAAPDASSSIKWGMPFYAIGGNTVCALAGFKAHVNLILSGPPGTFADPDGLLQGDGKTGQHLKLRSLDELPRAAVRRWLRAAVERARG